MSSKLMVDGKSLIQADFNIDTSNLEELFPKLFKLGFTEVPQHEPTTTRGHIYDHVLAKEMSVIACSALKDVLTDHYPLITKLEI
jgi:endonuclease/exonuclease/phosphatase (EEP) superfamily protein YafD